MYKGKDRSMMILNCLFCMGSAAILISNKKELIKNSAKYELLYSVRTQRAFDDTGYYSDHCEEDSEGLTGVTLKKDVLQVAGETLRCNISILGAKMLPIREKILHGVSLFHRKFIDKSTDIYMPNFKTVIQHFCLPTSGKALTLKLKKELKKGMWCGNLAWELELDQSVIYSLVWKCNKCIDCGSVASGGPWDDTIHQYPVG
ncbi:hypothetical protein Leryth_020512 [Lithospermum erythrorhizon]|nr:hypothetical protein Leryth_020512 [Lithospermum erythrorhizon]